MTANAYLSGDLSFAEWCESGVDDAAASEIDGVQMVALTARTLRLTKFPEGFLEGLYLTDDAMAKSLYDAAFVYAETYEGTFEFLVEMRRKLSRGGQFTDRAAKAVLNCMLAEARRADERRQRAEAEAERQAYVAQHGDIDLEIAQAAMYQYHLKHVVEQAARTALRQELNLLRNDGYRRNDPDAWRYNEADVQPVATGLDLSAVVTGTFTLVREDGTWLTVRVQEPRLKADRDGRRFVAYLSGTDNESDYTRFATIAPDGLASIWARFADRDDYRSALAHLAGLDADGQRGGMYQYALESGCCARCGRTLTVPASIANGIGPECIKHISWDDAA